LESSETVKLSSTPDYLKSIEVSSKSSKIKYEAKDAAKVVTRTTSLAEFLKNSAPPTDPSDTGAPKVPLKSALARKSAVEEKTAMMRTKSAAGATEENSSDFKAGEAQPAAQLTQEEKAKQEKKQKLRLLKLGRSKTTGVTSSSPSTPSPSASPASARNGSSQLAAGSVLEVSVDKSDLVVSPTTSFFTGAPSLDQFKSDSSAESLTDSFRSSSLLDETTAALFEKSNETPSSPTPTPKPVIPSKHKMALEPSATIDIVREALKEIDGDFAPFVAKEAIPPKTDPETDLKSLADFKPSVAEVKYVMESTTQTYFDEDSKEEISSNVQIKPADEQEREPAKSVEVADASVQTVHDVLVAEYEEFIEIDEDVYYQMQQQNNTISNRNSIVINNNKIINSNEVLDLELDLSDDDDDDDDQEDTFVHGTQNMQRSSVVLTATQNVINNYAVTTFPAESDGTSKAGVDDDVQSIASFALTQTQPQLQTEHDLPIQRGVTDEELGVAWTATKKTYAHADVQVGDDVLDRSTSGYSSTGESVAEVLPDGTTSVREVKVVVVEECKSCQHTKANEICNGIVEEMITNVITASEDKVESGNQTDLGITMPPFEVDPSSVSGTSDSEIQTTTSESQTKETITSNKTQDSEVQVIIGLSLESQLQLQQQLKEVQEKLKFVESQNAQLRTMLQKEQQNKEKLSNVFEGLTRMTLKKVVEGKF
jgi:hypothetical protein